MKNTKQTVRFQVTPDDKGLSMRNSSHLMAILGQKGIKAMDFFKMFNESIITRKNFIPNQQINVVLEVYINEKKQKKVIIKSASVHKSAGKMLHDVAQNGEITIDQIKEVAKKKISDLNCYNDDIDAATKILIGTAMAANLKIIGDK